MKTRKEMRDKLRDDLQVASSSTSYPQAKLDTELDQAYAFARGLFYWEDLNDAKKTSTQVNQDYYDYPDDWKLGSIQSLFIDGVEYQRRDYSDFYKYRLLHPANECDKRYFANHNKWYFVFPTPTLYVLNNLAILGNKQGDPLAVGDDAETIFSQKYEEGNEAIERKALSSCVKRTDLKLSQAEEAAALAILQSARKKELSNIEQDQHIDRPFFAYKRFF